MSDADELTPAQDRAVKWLSRFAFIPLTAALMIFPSREWTTAAIDGPAEECRGAPYAWSCDSPSISMLRDAYAEPFLADLAILGAVAASVMLILGFLLRGPRRPLFSGFAIFIWLWGGLCFAALAFAVTVEVSWSAGGIPEYYSLSPPRLGFGI